MPNYRFTKDVSDGDENYADYDYVNDIQSYYIGAIGSLVDGTDLMDTSEIIREFIIQLFIHEDLHNCIENIGIDSIATSQHETVYKWVKPDYKY